jgi:SAM-dependent methyltransferase
MSFYDDKNNYTLIKHDFSFYEVNPLPTKDFLANHYANKYYQNPLGTYQESYSEAELLNIQHQVYLIDYVLQNYINSNTKISKVLDLGCGEGFFGAHLKEKNYDVTLCDYSQYGVEKYNSHLLPYFQQGDIYTILQNVHKTYDFINFKNVLEHVTDPIDILHNIKKIMHNDSILRIQVPNDFSSFQKMLNEIYNIDSYFVSPPAHLSYFNFESLINTLIKCNFDVLCYHSDFPIELYLANPLSAYIPNRENGKMSHVARTNIDNFLFSKGYDLYLQYAMANAKVDLGRNVICYVKKQTI